MQYSFQTDRLVIVGVLDWPLDVCRDTRLVNETEVGPDEHRFELVEEPLVRVELASLYSLEPIACPRDEIISVSDIIVTERVRCRTIV